ncbi:hypothetical protein CALVIDRAFT_563661 [Calocera viscosa TUFC12733]|uniref:Branchpoint-bridging protein n=1 Tax=Calocera viscosa (strain TUFC12733) TaxID=1330018 RepID=A0A167MCP5_CALVF|nr:hypothetical protein CALVIDRAFT_563661 [Calocera viscosa TUFC12733]
MSWRGNGRAITGTNDVPLGARRWGPKEEPKPEPLSGESARPSTLHLIYTNTSQTQDPNAPRKRRSRWGDENTKAAIPGLPTAVSSTGVTAQDLDNYAIQVRLEEINRKLRLNDYIPPETARSPSPPPTYDAHGRRTNTREVRYRKKLEDERMRLIERAMKSDPTFRPPVEFHMQRRNRPQEKVYIPVKEFPEINFFGLLVGPRGNSLKKMERESGAKISIRGKGSVKEGKGKPDQFADDADEDLHCLVMADTEEKVTLCVNLINKVIETAASTPEGENDHKRNQLRELAALNGTLRDDENQVCQNCGNLGHRKYDCPEQRNYTANIVCRLCGNAGHMARDCTVKRDPNGQFSAPPQNNPFSPHNGPGSGPKTGFDSEYESLMAELGEGVTSSGGGGHGGDSSGSNIPPWRKPEMWITQQQQQQNQRLQGGFYPQQAGFQGLYSGALGGGQPVYDQNQYAAYQGYGGAEGQQTQWTPEQIQQYYAAMGYQQATPA